MVSGFDCSPLLCSLSSKALSLPLANTLPEESVTVGLEAASLAAVDKVEGALAEVVVVDFFILITIPPRFG